MTFWLEIDQNEESELRAIVERWQNPEYLTTDVSRKIATAMTPIVLQVLAISTTVDDVAADPATDLHFVPVDQDSVLVKEIDSAERIITDRPSVMVISSVDSNEVVTHNTINESVMTSLESDAFVTSGVLPWQ